MSVFVSDCAVVPISKVGHTVTLLVEKIEDGKAYFGQCKGGTVHKDFVVLEEGDVLEPGAKIHTETHWDYKNETYPLVLVVDKIENNLIFFKSCEGVVPLAFLEQSPDVQIWGLKENMK